MSDISSQAHARINEFIGDIGAITGQQHPTLNDGIQTLIDGYGQGGGTEEIETLIDESGVLDSTEGTVEDKLIQILEYLETFFKSTTVSFGYNGSTIERVVLNCKGMYSLQRTFYNCDKLTTVILTNTQNVSNWGNTFYGSKQIENIKTLNMSKADKDTIKSNWMCTAAVNVEFIPETIKNTVYFGNCSKFSNDTIQNIINALATVETTQTLTLHADVKAKLTTEQLTTITNKNWSVA